MILFSNHELAQRLEGVEVFNQEQYALTHKQFHPESDVAYKRVGSGSALFAGADSPVTQSFGMGLDGVVDEVQMLALEEFYREHGAPVNIEVSHLADMSLFTLLCERGYTIIELSTVLLRAISLDDVMPQMPKNVAIRATRADETESLARTIAAGFLESDDASAVPPEFVGMFTSWFQQPNVMCFAAEAEGAFVAGGSMYMPNGVAVMGGASTLPSSRGRGLQSALVGARLRQAVLSGCELAMVITQPGSTSQRNMEKQGFRVMYARTKFQKTW